MLHESLEARRLFAGVTILTHGYNGDITGWVATAAADIQARAGGKSASSIYTMSVTAAGRGLTVSSFVPDSGQKNYRQTTGGEVIIKLDWSTVSDGRVTTQDVADEVSDFLQFGKDSSPKLAELPIHLIGHSRGASLMSALSQDLGQAGVWVDQLTSLDPHPVDGVNDFFGADFGDAKMASYDNVAFADDYWRTDGDANNFDFDGEPVVGAHQGNLNSTVQKNFIASAHAAVTAYYAGTIDTSSLNGGDHPVISSWYKGTAAAPSRSATGFAFAALGGSTRPADGVSKLLGGKAPRTAAGQSGSQWANALNFTYRSNATISAGTTVATQFFVADRDSTARVDVYIDADTNPYDGASLLTGKTFPASSLLGGRVNVPTSGLNAGTYYLAEKTTDAAGHVRWSYTPNTIAITSPDFAHVVNGVLVLAGTAGNDRIIATQSGSTLSLTLNGAVQTFSATAITAVQIQAGAGNDSVDASAMTRATYVNGGAGLDTIVGGSGNDTLSGGAQSNEITGGAGDDVLNGSPGNDLIQGNGGNDRIYGNGGLDTLGRRKQCRPHLRRRPGCVAERRAGQRQAVRRRGQ